MSVDIEQLPFPAKVVRGAGAIGEIGHVCKRLGRRGFILGGKTALVNTRDDIITAFSRESIQAAAASWYGGEVTQDNIRSMAELAKEQHADFIVAVGGGKALDTGKAAAEQCGLPIVTVPTIAATCAAVTPLTVLYNEQSEFAGNLFLQHCPAAVIIDTEIILHAPVVWLEAGMGDTLAKMYELRAASAKIEADSLTISAVVNGQICYDIIRQFGREARKSAENKIVNAAFNSTVDAIILTAGLSSIFGGDRLRNAAAHAIYNGFTKVPSTHAVAHGLIVGYGNLCLLALEGRPDEEIISEIKLAAECGIPTSLQQIASMTRMELAVASEAAANAKAMSCMPFGVTPAMVVEAIQRVDQLAGNS